MVLAGIGEIVEAEAIVAPKSSSNNNIKSSSCGNDNYGNDSCGNDRSKQCDTVIEFNGLNENCSQPFSQSVSSLCQDMQIVPKMKEL